ncbi:10369_t:CDS:1, partial [Rhizophagus irregularis]
VTTTRANNHSWNWEQAIWILTSTKNEWRIPRFQEAMMVVKKVKEFKKLAVEQFSQWRSL